MKILNLYKNEWGKIKNLKSRIIYSLCLFLVFSLGGYINAVKNTKDTDTLLNAFKESSKAKGLSSENEWYVQAFKLFLNNSEATLLFIVLGVIPLLFLPIILLGINGLLVGVVLAKTDALKGIVFGLAPHGFTELTAVFIAVAIGITISEHLTKRLLRKDTDNTIKGILVEAFKTFFLIIVPLLIISGILESTLTPFLIEKFITK